MGTEGSVSTSPVERVTRQQQEIDPDGAWGIRARLEFLRLNRGQAPRAIQNSRKTRGVSFMVRNYYFGKIVFQSSFMLTTTHFFAMAASSALSRPPIFEPRS